MSLAALGVCAVAPLAAMGWVPGARTVPWPAFPLWGAAWLALAAAWARARGTPLSRERLAALARRAGAALRDATDRRGAGATTDEAGRPGAGTPGGRRRGGGRGGPPETPGAAHPHLLAGAGGTAVVWIVAVVARLALLPLLPHFSDDLYRYLWDGWVAIHGINPFLHAPSAPELEGIRTAWHALVNHPSVPTVYPPGAQAVFAALTLAAPSVLLFKGAWVAADLGVGWVLQRLGRRRGRARGAVLLWLWSPLVLMEVAWSGHMEPLGILPMAAALLFLPGPRAGAGGPGSGAAETGDGEDGRRPVPAGGDRAEGDVGDGRRWPALVGGGLLGIGASVKFAPALAVPALWRRRRATAAVAVLVPLLLCVPYAGAGPDLLGGLGEYASRWEFNTGLFLPLRALLGDGAARVVAAVLPAAVAVGAALRRWSVERALLWGMGAALLLSPTLHPWYLLWILPLALLRRSPSWVVWSALVFLAYSGLDVYRATGRWPEPWSLRLLVHLPFLLLLASEGTSLLRARGAGRGG